MSPYLDGPLLAGYFLTYLEYDFERAKAKRTSNSSIGFLLKFFRSGDNEDLIEDRYELLNGTLTTPFYSSEQTVVRDTVTPILLLRRS